MEVYKKYKVEDKYGNIYQMQYFGDTPKCVKVKHFRLNKGMSYYDKDRFYKEHKVVSEIE